MVWKMRASHVVRDPLFPIVSRKEKEAYREYSKLPKTIL